MAQERANEVEAIYQCLHCQMRYASNDFHCARSCMCGGMLLFRRDLTVDRLLLKTGSIAILAAQIAALPRS